MTSTPAPHEADPHEVDGLDFPTSLGTSTPDRIGLLGQDLTADLMGKVGFGELAFCVRGGVPLRRGRVREGCGPGDHVQPTRAAR